MASHSISDGNEIDEIEDVEDDSSDDGHCQPPAVSPKPTSVQGHHSPSRRFIFPERGFQHHQENASPKRLRPLSKYTKPQAPSAANISNSGSNHGQNRTHRVQATTPTKNGSVLSRVFRIGPSHNSFSIQSIRPPAPLGTRLQQLGKIKAEAEATVEEIVAGDEIESTLTEQLVAKQASSARWGGIKRRRLPSPLTSDLTSAGSQETAAQTSPESLTKTIPLPNMMLEQFPKVTLINQHNRVPAKPGRIHIFSLVINIGPLEKTKSSYNSSKVSLTVCDTSVTSFKVILWGKETNWADLIKAGDVVLMTNLRLNEFQERINGIATADTNVARLDGSVLAQYRGHAKIEEILKKLVKIRRDKALHLLDTGIAREPSLYMTLPPDFFVHKPSHPSATALVRYSRHTSESTVPRLIPSSATTTSLSMDSLVSIYACVHYLLLVTPDDVSTGWEIGAVLADGNMIKMKSTKDVSQINDMAPGRAFKFFGKYCLMEDGEYIFQIADSRVPLITNSTWPISGSRMETKRFTSVKSLKDHKFQGMTVVEARLLRACFSDPELQPSSDMRDFIRKYCLGCLRLAKISLSEPAIFFCPICDLGPAKRGSSEFCWLYPRFEITLGDQSCVHHNLSKELIQVRCDQALGDQLFPTVPASHWVYDANSFVRSRSRWKRLFKLMNLSGQDSDSDVVSETTDAPRIRVHLTVGRNDIFVATKLDYIWT